MIKYSHIFKLLLGGAASILAAFSYAVVIDNDKTKTQGGFFSIDVTSGGETETVLITDPGASHPGEDIAYGYEAYIIVAGSSSRLSGSTPVSIGDDKLSSNGTFTGSSGNTISWTVESSIANDALQMRNVYTFTANSGALGDLQFIQYLDEDVLGYRDDFFFTRGTTANNDIELYTIDNDNAVALGISHSGAQHSEQGLVNAIFNGWGACTFSKRAQLTSGSYVYAPEGLICSDLVNSNATHPDAGAVKGAADIVSAIAWTAVSSQQQAVISTTLGGVPDVGIAVAVNDYGNITENNSDINSFEIDVLLNDVALDVPVTASTFSTPSNGTITTSGSVVRYTPNAGFFGNDIFTYQIVDKSGDTDTASVVIKVLEDSDDDNVSNDDEAANGTDPNNPDTDGDGKNDGVEGTTDSDNDGIIDALEPSDQDSDGDGVSDENDGSNNDPSNDSDGDGLSNSVEQTRGTNPLLKDTDGDEKDDNAEGASNSDGDGLIDALESSLVDTDNDGVNNELDAENTNPNNDSDNDGIGNAYEVASGTDPLDNSSTPLDTDGDRVPDVIDLDDDNDGRTDEEENTAVPPTSIIDACDPDKRNDECDFDNDGIKNLIDTDDDNDNVPDISDPDSAQFCIPNNLPAICADYNEQIAISELVEDLNGNTNGTLITAAQLDDIRGITNVNAANIADYNAAFIAMPSPFADINNPSVAEINAVIAAVNAEVVAETALQKIQNYATAGGTTTAPVVQDFTDAVVNNAAANLVKINQVIASKNAADVDTRKDVQDIVDAVNKLEGYLADDGVPKTSPKPTVKDLSNAGLKNVTAANLDDVLTKLDDPATDTTSLAKMQEAVESVNAAIAKAAALQKIQDYAESDADGSKAAPVAQDFVEAGVNNAATNLNKVNQAIALKDADGVDETQEVQAIVDAINGGGLDADGDGLPNIVDTDDDNDGIPDTSETSADALNACVPNNRHPKCDFDKDGIKNDSDSDDDGDGVVDANEPGEESNPNNDSDDDGISNVHEQQAGTNPEDGDDTPLDTDGDKIPDVVDNDDDNDGLLDSDETNEGRINPDQDNDGICDGNLAVADVCSSGPDANPTNPDSDGNGICDGIMAMSAKGDFKGCMPNVNTDPAVDTDGDGIKDEAELSGDTDDDGIPDYLDPTSDGPGYGDSDNDGIDDKEECGPQLPCRDSDSDGIYDYRDTDSDNDGISDDEEADGVLGNGDDGTNPAKDTDDDGIPDYRDEDSDNDGSLDKDEANKDSDDDGIPDVIDHDDGAGETDTELGGGDSDNDGLTDAEECPNYPTNCPDTDNDGKPDYLDNNNDSDADGISDNDEDPNTDGDNDPTTNPRDTDGDGTPDYLDDDADNDGKKDQDERDEPYDANNPRDTDNDGIPDVVDEDDGTAGSDNEGSGAGDSDNDGIEDDIECGTAPCRDSDGDGLPDYADTDSDNDGISDAVEVGDNANQPQDTDGDGIPDIVDQVNGREGENGGDSDGDGIADSVECNSWPNCVDTDRDGIADYLDGDSSPAGTNPDPAPEANLGTIKTGVHGAGSMSFVWISMLSLLVVMARRRSAVIVALPLIFSSLAANAAWWDEMDLYAGAGYGQSYLSPGVGGTQYSIDDHTQDAWKLSAGWDWNDHISIEGYYANLGSVSLNPGGEMGYRMLGGDAMLHYWARGGERVRGSIALYAKAGLNHMTNNGEGVSYESKNKGQLFGAIGAELYLPQKFSVRLEIDSYDTDASLFSLNVIKRFGFKSRTPSLPPLPIVDKKAQQEEQFAAMVEELPATAAGPKVVQLIPVVLDTDLDGLLDDEDQCPYTPKNVSVNELGCATYHGKVGDLIANVRFEINSSLLTEPSKIALNEIVDMLATYQAVKIEVQAHSDNTGSAGYNRTLSQKRAESVVSYLEQKKIAADRLVAKGYGEDNPIADNETHTGRAKNRRVEFILKAR